MTSTASPPIALARTPHSGTQAKTFNPASAFAGATTASNAANAAAPKMFLMILPQFAECVQVAASLETISALPYGYHRTYMMLVLKREISVYGQ